MTDDQAIAELTKLGTPLEAYFLLGERGQQLVAFWHPRNRLMACSIDDRNQFRACIRVLKKRGAREFQSTREVYAVAIQEQWPNSEKVQDESNA
jgi:hypothetical protein